VTWVTRSPKNVRRTRGLNWLDASWSTTIVIENVNPATVMSEPAITESSVRAAEPSPWKNQPMPPRSMPRSTSTRTIPSAAKTAVITPGTNPRLCMRFSHSVLTRPGTESVLAGRGPRGPGSSLR
jgi:hypothetical protein